MLGVGSRFTSHKNPHHIDKYTNIRYIYLKKNPQGKL